MTFTNVSAEERLSSVKLNLFVLPPPPLWFQYQKQGKDVEKVKQRLAEIANYVDKVKLTNMIT